MGEVIDRAGEVPTIELAGESSRATVAPSRGGMLTALRVGERDVLYLDEATLLDPTKNVRGGAPVLFPSPGKLAHDVWSFGGRIGSMKQHGFARNLPFSVAGRGTSPAPYVVLRAHSTDDTLRLYPYAFVLELTYTLLPSGVRIDQRIENRGTQPMPFGFGFHPYFRVPDAVKATAHVPTTATRAFDNTTKREIDVPEGGFDLTAKEVDAHLVDHGRSSAELEVAGETDISVIGSAEYGRWVVWTLAGKDFVCLEPWTCPGNALNTGEDLLLVAPGETHVMFVEIALRSDAPLSVRPRGSAGAAR